MSLKTTIFIFMVFSSFFFIMSTNVEANTGLNIGEEAPDFKLKDLNGKTVRLSDYRGKSVMINFWATWCPPCKKEMLDVETFSKKKQDHWIVLAVNVDGGNEKGVRQFVKERNLTFPILIDNNDMVSNQYDILSIPTTFFLNEDGIIIKKGFTMLTLQQMMEMTKD
ncbi:redoxin domain-containing protein [Niallia circulans]|uniref:redoxin domain-containing protein n=1 Tax=Niallia circulans TaxID=1397 RepID=UPI002E2B53B3|nr:redoxin domain-containing protein [Niallia circulans]